MTSTANCGDADLVHASLQGDREAFGNIVARYQSLVSSLAYSATGSLTQSEDLAQETFIEAWKHLAGLREPEKLRSWLCGIARNRIHQSLRGQKREPGHEAEALESLIEAPSLEPSPPDRAITSEEADILWRALERIPETYRLPLVLFYREHQSVERVAQALDLTEETVRQRLSRGRKLLQEEVQAFVETALTRTGPGKAFTLGVIAALPLTATSVKAATGLAAAKGAAGAKGAVLLPVVSGLASMVGAVALSWKFAADEAQAPGERKFLRRVGLAQVLLFLFLLGGSVLLALSGSLGRAWLTVALFALLALVLVVNSVLVVPWVVRRQLEFRMEEGVWPQVSPEVPEATEHSIALRKALKQSLPMLVMLAGCVFVLPWKKNWLGCVGYLGLPAFFALWHVRRLYRQFRGQARLSSFSVKLFSKHPLLGGVAGVFLICVICIFMSNLGVRYLSWLNTGTFPELPLVPSLTRQFLLGLLVAALVVGLLAILGRKWLPVGSGWGGKFRSPWLDQIQAVAEGPQAILDSTYGSLFEELKLDSERRAKFKGLLMKRATVGVQAGMPLMNPCLNRDKRASLLRDLKADRDACTEQIRELLGNGFAAFQEFEQEIPCRMLLDQLIRKTENTPLALTADQQAHLLEAIREARRRYPWTSDLARQNQEVPLSELYTQSRVETFAREQSEFDRQFLTQARQLLSLEQIALFEKLQTQRRESQINQFRMGIKLFGSTAGQTRAQGDSN